MQCLRPDLDDLGAEWACRLPGLAQLWAVTKGDSRIKIAILDGPTDFSIASEAGLASPSALEHGTLVTSIVSGRQRTNMLGICPECTVLNIDIFRDDGAGAAVCQQNDLAKAITEAINLGANIINISASQQDDLTNTATSLSLALQEALKRDILVISAAGNQGCACDSIPASVPGVLAVGAHDEQGAPLPMSNWGPGHQGEGILAPGLNIPGACVGGGTCRRTGTSFAAAVVTGVSALLMSLQLRQGERPSGSKVKKVLLDSCDQCLPELSDLCSSSLKGVINVNRAMIALLSSLTKNQNPEISMATGAMDYEQKNQIMSSDQSSQPTIEDRQPRDLTIAPPTSQIGGIRPADCGCGGSANGQCSCGQVKSPQLVYAIGRLGISFSTQARRDSIWRSVNGGREGDLKPISDEALRALFSEHPHQAQAVVWTLNRSEIPLYAIVPTGAFAAETYEWLVNEWSDNDVEFVSMPGTLAGRIQLYDGLVVDAIIPDLRGMFSWEQKNYTNALVKARMEKNADIKEDDVRREIGRFLGKIFFRIRNRGVLPEERALNAAATNAFNVSSIIEDAGREGLTLKDVSAERSPLNRPGSEYYDVLLTFFDPRDRLGTAPLLARLTIDVSDTVPVVIGDPVIWYEY